MGMDFDVSDAVYGTFALLHSRSLSLSAPQSTAYPGRLSPLIVDPADAEPATVREVKVAHWLRSKPPMQLTGSYLLILIHMQHETTHTAPG